MQLEHSFTVPVTIDEAWPVLLDIERIAPCMPGAAVDTVDGDEFTGTVKVRLGPISLTYKGKASFVEKDETAHRAVIDARGRDARGNGTAAAKVTATLTESGAATEVHVVTDLDITGKPAQFGRGVMVDVGNKLIWQFADCLAGKLSGEGEQSGTTASGEQAGATGPDEQSGATASGEQAGTAGSDQVAGAGNTHLPSAAVSGIAARPAPTTPPDVEPINLLQSAGPAVAKRVAPVIGALVLIALIVLRCRRRG